MKDIIIPILCFLSFNTYAQPNCLVQNKNIINGQTENYQGWNSLTAQNIDLDNGGNSELMARQTINIKTEFYTKSESEVHIYCDNTFPVCDDFSNFLRQSNIIENNIMKDDPMNIEISFQPKQQALSFTIFPNPNNGLFSITIQNSEDKFTTFEFIDAFGRVIKKISTAEVSIQVDLTAFKKGVYYARAKSINSNSKKNFNSIKF